MRGSDKIIRHHALAERSSEFLLCEQFRREISQVEITSRERVDVCHRLPCLLLSSFPFSS